MLRQHLHRDAVRLHHLSLSLSLLLAWWAR